MWGFHGRYWRPSLALAGAPRTFTGPIIATVRPPTGGAFFYFLQRNPKGLSGGPASPSSLSQSLQLRCVPAQPLGALTQWPSPRGHE